MTALPDALPEPPPDGLPPARPLRHEPLADGDASRALRAACDAVARDLGTWPAEELLEEAVAHRAWWLQQWPGGAPHVLGLMAQDVQEAVHGVDPLWPLCPDHGDHPLFVEPDLGPDPFWVCHRSGLPVASVGSLLPG